MVLDQELLQRMEPLWFWTKNCYKEWNLYGSGPRIVTKNGTSNNSRLKTYKCLYRRFEGKNHGRTEIEKIGQLLVV